MEYVRDALIPKRYRKIEKGGSGWDYNFSLQILTIRNLHLDHESRYERTLSESVLDGSTRLFRSFPNPKALIEAALTLAIATRVQAKMRVTLVMVFRITSDTWLLQIEL
jgi:hypothetical protein